ncbi:hypothetical protein CFC21_105250 [Triticum aestivum]|uniref:MYND-type domain-containing protein n=2 Tax=Triticum aestivum TaxID=4565 RepID=A0A9R1MBR9_WHEAT|nr:uncharacterized protein LOC123158439 [Triticum aestivum]KAF7104347.1 hypothetical protein CFC21_105250 [Triticum aestivum]
MPGVGSATLARGWGTICRRGSSRRSSASWFVLFIAGCRRARRLALLFVDAAGLATPDDHNRHHAAYAMPPGRNQQQPTAQPQRAAQPRRCAQCGVASNKMCGLCRRMKYCSRECQLKHWHSDHKFKCEQMRLLDPVENLPCGVEANGKNNEKRKQRSNDCYPPNKRSKNSSSLMFDTEQVQVNGTGDEDGRSPTPSSAAPTRNSPLERKAEKELRKGGHGVVFQSGVQEMITVKKEMEVEKKQEKGSRGMEVKAMEERKVAIEEEKLRVLREEMCLKKMEQEYKIMFMDISALSETQRKYVELMRARILASRMGAGAIRSRNGTE